MKRIINISALLAAGIMLLAGCQKEEFSTDQYADDRVSLNVYGPQPVMRGGILRFLGSNLDQVTSIVIPGVDPVTDIEVVQARGSGHRHRSSAGRGAERDQNNRAERRP